jgi:hypothetical protein
MNNLHTRLAKLEAKLKDNAITIQMADGSSRRVYVRRLMQIVPEVFSGIVKEDTRDILDCVSSNCVEAGEGHLVELIQVVGESHRAGEGDPSQMTAEEREQSIELGGKIAALTDKDPGLFEKMQEMEIMADPKDLSNESLAVLDDIGREIETRRSPAQTLSIQ